MCCASVCDTSATAMPLLAMPLLAIRLPAMRLPRPCVYVRHGRLQLHLPVSYSRMHIYIHWCPLAAESILPKILIMSSQPNRLTTFPHSSHYYEKGLPRKRRSSTNEDAEKCRVVRTRDSPPPSLPTLPFHRSQQNNEPPPKVVQNTSTQNTSTNADQFRGIIAEYQAGEGIVAHRADAKFLLVLLKKKPRSRSDAKHRLTSTDHPNLVNLLTFFEDDGVINLVYECMHVSLLQLQASPYNAFVEYEIAAICKEV